MATNSAITYDNRKTYTGINKLFKLTNNSPMEIRIYNLAEFTEIPMEIIIKEFIKTLDNEEEITLINIKEKFEKYLSKILNESNFQISFDNQLDEFLEITKRDLDNIPLDTYVEKLFKEVKNFNYNQLGTLKKEIKEKINLNEYMFKSILCNLNIKKEEEKEFLENLKKLFIFDTFLRDYTGIIVAGYEKNNFFGSVMDFKINYLYEDKFIIRDIEIENTNRNEVKLKTFAQDDVINTFINNMKYETEDKIIKFFEYYHNKLLNFIKENLEHNDKLSENEINHIQNEISTIEQSYNLLKNTL